MSFVINGIKIKERKDYLEKGSRSRLETTMRSDLKKDFVLLSKHLKLPQSIMLDVLVEMLKEDDDMLREFVHRVRNY